MLTGVGRKQKHVKTCLLSWMLTKVLRVSFTAMALALPGNSSQVMTQTG
jgi:hypothetical protein